MNRIVCYTCITGGYDRLIPLSVKNPDIDYICFTDCVGEEAEVNGWTLREIPKDLKSLSSVKQQRCIKILPNKYLSEYDCSIYIDGNIEVVADLKFPLSQLKLNQCPIWMKIHPSRTCAYKEEQAVIRLKKDSPTNTFKQMSRYKHEGFPLNAGLCETNVIVRMHNDYRCCQLMYAWAKEVISGSHRDQLSFNYCAWKTNVRYGLLDSLFLSCFRIHKGHFVKAAVKQEETKETAKESDVYPVTVIMATHNRTETAVVTLQSLIDNLEYGNLHWCIADDRSEIGHLETLLTVFQKNGIPSDRITVRMASGSKYGLGYTLNESLKAAFQVGDVVLTTEDDFHLSRKLDISGYVQDMLKENIAGIRLASLSYPENSYKYKDGSKYIWVKASDKHKNRYIFNNQVMLRHRRVYDLIGFYPENCDTNTQEAAGVFAYNKATNYGNKKGSPAVLFPVGWPIGRVNDENKPFVHIGQSTEGRGWEGFLTDQFNQKLQRIEEISPAIDVVFISDDGYIEKTFVSILSMKQTKRPSTMMKVSLILRKKNDLAYSLADIVSTNDFEIEVIIPEEEFLNKLIEYEHYDQRNKGIAATSTALLKFELPWLFPDKNKIIFMDGDTIVRKDLTELFYTDVSQCHLAAVKDNGEFKPNDKLPIERRQPTYFNSGVMVMNLKAFRENGYTDKLWELKKTLKDQSLVDQNAFNALFKGKARLIDVKFNYICNLIRFKDLYNKKFDVVKQIYGCSYNSYSELENQAVIVHYAGARVKPWLDMPSFMQSEWRFYDMKLKILEERL